MAGDGPDVVYPLGPTRGDHVELRYSLRSLANLPHRRVWIVGAAPPKWVIGVEHIPVPQVRSKYENSRLNLLTACKHPDLADRWILMNDDFYVLTPLDNLPVYHRGPLTRVESYYRAKGHYAYGVGFRQTRELLMSWGHTPAEMLAYELHAPMPLEKQKFLDVLTRAQRSRFIKALKIRSLYGVHFKIGGTRLRDPKITGHGSPNPNAPFLSTSRPAQLAAHTPIGRILRTRFPEPCEYEAAAMAKVG